MLEVVEIEVVRDSAARVFGEIDAPVLAPSASAKLCVFVFDSRVPLTPITPEQRPSRVVTHQRHYGSQAMKDRLPHY